MNNHNTTSNEVHASSSTSPYPSSSSHKNLTVIVDDDDIDTSSFEDLSMNAALGIDASEFPPPPTTTTVADYFLVPRILSRSKDDKSNKNLFHDLYPIYTLPPNERDLLLFLHL